MLEARIPKGFRDSMPDDEFHRQNMIETIRKACFLMGYMPIDTPMVEYSEILLGKGGGETDKQVYSFTDPGGRDLSLRYDLTVPLARFVAQHMHALPIPFRRFHVGKVFRGEKPQKGRYREFYQCDWDLIAEASIPGDWEILQSVWFIFQRLQVPDIRIHVSHRSVLPSVLQTLGVTENVAEIMRTIDKRAKIGTDNCAEQLTQYLAEDAVDTMLRLIGSTASSNELLHQLEGILSQEHYDHISSIFSMVEDQAISEHIVFDPGITRGLDYYTGVVFETFLNDFPQLGSVCSGGRYDKLAALYSKHSISGIGASIGLDRLLAGTAELSSQSLGRPSKRVLICNETHEDLMGYQSFLQQLRAHDIASELFPYDTQIKKQFTYAEKAGISFVFRMKDKRHGIIKHLASSASEEIRDLQSLLSFLERYATTT